MLSDTLLQTVNNASVSIYFKYTSKLFFRAEETAIIDKTFLNLQEYIEKNINLQLWTYKTNLFDHRLFVN